MQLQNKRETESRAQKNHWKRGENTERLLERTTISERRPKEERESESRPKKERESERRLKAQQEHTENSTELNSQKEKLKEKINKVHPS